MKKSIVILSLLCCLCVSAATRAQGKPQEICIDNLLAEGKIVPMIVVMPDGALRVDQFPDELTNDIYVLFSQTKAIVAVALMTLYEQGKFALDDPISKYIPGFSEEVLTSVADDGTYTAVPAERPVTVGDLLCHSSGYLAPLTNQLNRILTASGQEEDRPADEPQLLPLVLISISLNN